MASSTLMNLRGIGSLQAGAPRACRVSAGVHTGSLHLAQSAARRSLGFPGRCLPAASRFAAQAAATAEAPTEQSFEYQAEVDRLMDMIINSLYSNRDIFLRELVSNGSDALDKMRFVSLTDKNALASGQDLEIRIQGFPEERKLVIEDSGIGMTRQEMLDSLGTIARSGTARFAEAMKEAKGDTSLIGRFGVGFYSSFLVAERVEVQSKSNNDEAQWHFESTLGSSSFKISQDQQADLPRGTRVTLHLKEDAAEMASPNKLQTLIKQYSQFIQFPIRLWNSRQETDQVPDEEATAKKQAEADEAAKKEGKEGAEPVTPQTKSQPREEWGWAVQNDAKPLWTRTPREVSDPEYAEFFKQTFQEFMDPAAKVHFSAEGTIEFTALLYIPGMAPFQPEDGMKKPKNIKLFVRRVFISDEFDESLMPRYLSFAKGIVDSSDLPLNVSREILQESRVVRVIKKQLTKRTLDMLTELAKKPKPEGGDAAEGARRSDYELFWSSFGKFLKLGIVEDQANRPVLSKLLRVHTSKSEDDPIPLADYVAGMQEGQKGIYYIAADSLAAAAASPFVEQLQRRGLEVVYLTEVIDEPMFNHLEKFDGHQLIDVGREGVDLGDTEEDKQEAQAAQADLKPLMELMKEALGDRVEKVVPSQRLADSPCALATSKFGWSAYQERIMRSQLMADQQSQEYMRGRKTLELNPQHPIIQSLKSTASSNPGEAKAMTQLLYDAALVTSGFVVESPKDFGNRIYGLMGGVLSASSGNGSGAAEQNARRQQRRDGAKPDAEAVTADSIVEGDGGGGSPWGN